jgi:hypothetical protein
VFNQKHARLEHEHGHGHGHGHLQFALVRWKAELHWVEQSKVKHKHSHLEEFVDENGKLFIERKQKHWNLQLQRIKTRSESNGEMVNTKSRRAVN